MSIIAAIKIVIQNINVLLKIKRPHSKSVPALDFVFVVLSVSTASCSDDNPALSAENFEIQDKEMDVAAKNPNTNTVMS